MVVKDGGAETNVNIRINKAKGFLIYKDSCGDRRRCQEIQN
jgi:hypothetical protein